MSDLHEMKVLWDLGRLQFCDVSSFIDLLINENEMLKIKTEEISDVFSGPNIICPTQPSIKGN